MGDFSGDSRALFFNLDGSHMDVFYNHSFYHTFVSYCPYTQHVLENVVSVNVLLV